jgi:hypothetical protein
LPQTQASQKMTVSGQPWRRKSLVEAPRS